MSTVRGIVGLERAYINAENVTRQTELLIKACEEGNQKEVEALIRVGADVDAKSEGRIDEGWTGLMKAAWNGHHEIIELLIRARANINAVGKYGYTALICAAIKGESEVVDLLIKAGAKVDVKDKKGETALIWASWEKHIATVDMLLRAGAKVNVVDMKGNTVDQIAERIRSEDMIKLLEKRMRWDQGRRRLIMLLKSSDAV